MSESNGRAPPKSILKNRQSQNEESRYGQERSMMNLDYQGQSVTTSNWDNVLQRPPVQSQGMKADQVLGLDRSLRQKLNEFMSRKGDLLFRPLGSDEVPLSEDKGRHKSTQDHYAILPSLDHFLRLDPVERRRYFFNSVQPGDIVIGTLVTKTVQGLHLSLLCMEGGRGFILEGLDIKSFCPASQMIPAIDPKNPNKIFAPGDLVRCEILKVTADSEKLITGMKGNALSPEMQHSYQLGLIFQSDLPQQFALAMAEKSEKRGKKSNYEEMLTSSLGFRNPNNIAHLASSMGILSNKSTLMTGLSGSFPPQDFASELRRQQNGRWAHGHVAEGIRYFKAANFTEAFQCLNKALTIDVENVEGLVARGALYANKATYEKAIADFESALKYNPTHFNARKYLAETLVAYGRYLETNGKVDDAVGAYSKCLCIRSDHPEAKDALWSIYARTEKLDTSKMAGPVALKTVEMKEKLKAILHSELASAEELTKGKSADDKSKSKKSKKEKKKRGRDSSNSDISSSSDSDSESESSSSDDDSRRGKKKKSKKRKSRKKKSKRDSSTAKPPKEVSLSPFSKRLDSGNNAYPGGSFELNESTYAQWGKRLGIQKPEEIDLEGDSKKSKKDKKKSRKSKRKRKRHSSDSSSSDSDSSQSVGKKKSKKSSDKASVGLIGDLPDLGDLEAKLSAFYSKVEQEKVESLIQPPDNLRNNDIQVTLEQNIDPYPRGAEMYENIVRKIEVRQPGDDRYERSTDYRSEQFNEVGVGGLGKIELRTDEYGNFIHPENIVRTVTNDGSEQLRPKFEMKFRPQLSQNPAALAQTQEQKSELGSKWRIVGAQGLEESYTVTRLDGTAVVKSQDEPERTNTGQTKPVLGLDHSIPNPLSPDKKSAKREENRNYRGRRSISGSRSRSRSRSRSIGRGRRYGRGRSRSRSLGRSRSRSRERRRFSRSNSRSRSRSRSPNYRRNYGRSSYRGNRPPTRFFRGFRTERGSRRGYGYDRGGYNMSKFQSNRSRFRQSRSRSRGRDSRSLSPRGRDRRSRSRDRNRRTSRERRRSPSGSPTKSSRSKPSESKKNVDSSSSIPKEAEKDDASLDSVIVVEVKADAGKDKEKEKEVSTSTNSEIQIGTLTTTKAAEVEELLDQRNALKKEEMRERNPDFFRPV